MPVGQDKLYGLPGPQNSAVLMDIISKLKQDLHHSRAENGKLVDQLNCLISLVKRAWSGEQGAALHLANIVGMEPPSFVPSEPNRNTPMPDKTRAVRNWERLSIKLLEKEYAEIQQVIQERQRAHILNRQQYMNEVLDDHEAEMNKLHLHKNSKVEAVDKQFIRCYSAKNQHERRAKSAVYRPRSGHRGDTISRAADMAERADVRVEDLLGQTPGPQAGTWLGENQNNNVFNGLHKTSENERLLYRPRENFDDPNRYKQGNLFDPDVIFSPEMMKAHAKGRPSSATEHGGIAGKMALKSRPGSAVFLTEGKPERPLKYETTRPVKRNMPGSKPSTRGRLHSAPARRTSAPSTILKKDLHSKSDVDYRYANQSTNANPDHDGLSPEQQPDFEFNENIPFEDFDSEPCGPNGSFSEDSHNNGNAATGEDSEQKPPIAVKVKKPHPMDKFVNDLRHMNEMENDFKKSAISLQKKLGLQSGGYIY